MAEVVENLETEGNTEDEQFTFVVHGAVLACEHGSHLNYLRLPRSHGVFVKEKAIASVGDRNKRNIQTFGICLKKEEVCVPRCEIDWIDGKEDFLVDGKHALLNCCHTQCVKGGEISIIHDGQEDVKIPEQGF